MSSGSWLDHQLLLQDLWDFVQQSWFIVYWNQNYQKLSYYLHVLDLSRVMKYKNDNIMWPFPIKLLRFPSSLHKICKLCVIVHIVYLFIMCLHHSALRLTFWTLRFIRIHEEKPRHTTDKVDIIWHSELFQFSSTGLPVTTMTRCQMSDITTRQLWYICLGLTLSI